MRVVRLNHSVNVKTEKRRQRHTDVSWGEAGQQFYGVSQQNMKHTFHAVRLNDIKMSLDTNLWCNWQGANTQVNIQLQVSCWAELQLICSETLEESGAEPDLLEG